MINFISNKILIKFLITKKWWKKKKESKKDEEEDKKVDAKNTE